MKAPSLRIVLHGQPERHAAGGARDADRADLAGSKMILAYRPEVDLDGTSAGLVLSHHDAALTRDGTHQLPAQRPGDPACDERRRDPVAPPFTRVVDPDLRDSGQESAAVDRREELRDRLPPGPQARPLKVSEA